MLKKLKAFVKDLVSTNWIIFTGTVMGILTGVVYLACVLLMKAIQLDVWLAWLAFLGGWIGFGVRQFRHKRETYVPLQEAKNAGMELQQPNTPR